MSARLIRHIHFRIGNETSRFLETGKTAEGKYKQLEEYRDVLNRVALFLDLVLSLEKDQGKVTAINEIAREVKRIQIEVA